MPCLWGQMKVLDTIIEIIVTMGPCSRTRPSPGIFLSRNVVLVGVSGLWRRKVWHLEHRVPASVRNTQRTRVNFDPLSVKLLLYEVVDRQKGTIGINRVVA